MPGGTSKFDATLGTWVDRLLPVAIFLMITAAHPIGAPNRYYHGPLLNFTASHYISLFSIHEDGFHIMPVKIFRLWPSWPNRLSRVAKLPQARCGDDLANPSASAHPCPALT
jgi:hypothetical protein